MEKFQATSISFIFVYHDVTSFFLTIWPQIYRSASISLFLGNKGTCKEKQLLQKWIYFSVSLLLQDTC